MNMVIENKNESDLIFGNLLETVLFSVNLEEELSKNNISETISDRVDKQLIGLENQKQKVTQDGIEKINNLSSIHDEKTKLIDKKISDLKKKKEKIINELTEEEIRDLLESKFGYDFRYDDFEDACLTEGFLFKNRKKEKVTTNLEKENCEKMLFNGSSGDALKYFLKDEINNNNIKEINIAKKMKGRPSVEKILANLRKELKLKSPDKMTLKKLKLEFRTQFHIVKNELLD